MRRMQQGLSAKVVFGVAVLLLFPLVGGAANQMAQISGHVRDSSGVPVTGALVVVAATSPIPDRITLTDKTGSFAIMDLFAGQYSVKVSMPRFLSATKQGIQLYAGESAVLTINLQNAMDVVRRAISREKAQSEDILWTLRSSRATQPVLRFAEDRSKEAPKLLPGPDYSGYFQVYSKSVETSSGASEGVGSQFSVTMPLDTNSKVTVTGQYTELPTQPRGVGATYEFMPANRHKAAVGVNMRQGALFADPIRTDSLREVQVKYGEDFQFSDHLVFNYGAEVGRAGTLSSFNSLRQRFGVAWVPASRTTISISASSQAPAAADDSVRGKEYFDRTLVVPPALERYSHAEIGFTHILTENIEFSTAAFRDRTDTQALFVSAPNGRHGVLFLDTRNSPSEGIRVNLNREFRKNFEVGLGFTSVTGVGLDNRASSLEEVRNQLIRRRFHVVAARFKADVETTQTQITAIYRWTNAYAASYLDPYQRLMEYNDPTLSVSIAQDLPTWRMFPGKVQAILDARNVLDQSFGPQRTQLTQYPRLVKGGINIKF